MRTKRVYSLIAGITLAAILLSACGTATPAVTQAPAATSAPTTVPATEAVAPTEAAVPTATTVAGPVACPAITVADPQGVAPGAWPQQYEVAEFETAANCVMAFTIRTEYDERL